MLALNKSEKEAVVRRFPGICVIRTMKQRSKRHHYYCEENWRVARFLDELRGIADSRTKCRKPGYGTTRTAKKTH